MSKKKAKPSTKKQFTISDIVKEIVATEHEISADMLESRDINNDEYKERVTSINNTFKGVKTMDKLFVALDQIGFDHGDASDYILRIAIKY